MYVCLCHGITDTQINNSIDNGATSMKQLSAELKVGTQCGKCCQTTKKVLNSRLMQIAEPMPKVA